MSSMDRAQALMASYVAATRRLRIVIAAGSLATSWTSRVGPLFRNFKLFLYVAVALLAAQITLAVKPQVGVYVNAAAFAALIGLALLRAKVRQLAISAAILPVATMIMLSLPQSTTFTTTTVFYDAMLLLALVYRYMFTLDEPLEQSRLGLRGYALGAPLMIILGQVFGVLGYLLLRHQYPFSHASWSVVIPAAFVIAATEETFLRGLIQQRASYLVHPWLAIALSVLVYLLMGLGHNAVLTLLYGLVMGTLLSVVYYKKPNLLLTFTLNATSKLVYLGLLAAFVLH